MQSISVLTIIVVVLASLYAIDNCVDSIEDFTGIQTSRNNIFSGGNGSLDNPYQISNISGLQNINSNLSASYILINDIDGTDTKTWNDGLGFKPIYNMVPNPPGYDYLPFTGIFNGNGFKISNLFMDKPSRPYPDYTGLFGFCKDATIQNLILENVSIIGLEYTGGLIGHGINCNVSNCFIDGTIEIENADAFQPPDYSGGLIGVSDKGRINNCISKVNISGGNDVGLLVGRNNGGIITNSSVNGSIRGKRSCGGIVGYNTGNVSYCSSYVTFHEKEDFYYQSGGVVGENQGVVWKSNSKGLIPTGNQIGGISGRNGGLTIHCYSEMELVGNQNVGGVVGHNEWGAVSNSHSSGKITSNTLAGGVCGGSSGTIIKCSSDGNVSGTEGVGGIVGYTYTNIIDCYYYGNITGQKDVGGIVGNINYPLSIENCFYDINKSTINGNKMINRFGIYHTQFINWKNNDLSLNIDNYLTKLPNGDYNIGDIEDLKNSIPFFIIGDYNYRITENISFIDEIGFHIPIITKGKIEGSGRTITNLVINNSINSRNGFIEYADRATINNLHLKNITLHSIGFTGGFISESTSNTIITNCSVNGTIMGEGHNIGGFVGYNFGNIERCFSNVNIISNHGENVGGFVGLNFGGDIKNSYCIGEIKAKKNVGGFIGSNWWHGTVENSYTIAKTIGESNVGGFIGEIQSGSIINSIWNNQTSIQMGSPGGIGQNTYSMRLKSTYTSIGWDFGKIWSIIENHTFPYFNYQYSQPEIITDYLPNGIVDEEYTEEIKFDVFTYPGRNDYYSFSLKTNANWLNITESGFLVGLPRIWDVGDYWVNIELIDISGGEVSKNLSLIVEGENQPPEQKLLVENLTSHEDEIIEYDLNQIFFDPDGDTLEYNSNSTQHLSVIIEDSEILITPLANWSGNEKISIFCQDEEFKIQLDLDIVIIPVNDKPIILFVNYKEKYNQSEEIKLSAITEDPDSPYNDELSVIWRDEGTIIGQGNQIEPVLNPGTYNISISVTDLSGESSVTNIHFIIENNSNDTDTDTDNDSDNRTKEEEEKSAPWLYIIIGMIILLIAIPIIFILLKRKKSPIEE